MHPLQPAGFPNGAQKLAKLYQKRWTLEHLFQELGLVLHAESDTFFDLKAALLGFCGGLMSYNVLSLLKADLRAKDSTCSPDPNLSSGMLKIGVICRGRRGVLSVIEPPARRPCD